MTKDTINMSVAVREAVQKRVAARKAFATTTIVNDVLRALPEPSGSAADFDTFCRQFTVSEFAKREINKITTPDGAKHLQLVMTGYEHVQCFYRVVRDGAEICIPVEDCTDAELEAKAKEHEAQAEGHLAHAQEIREYVRERKKARGWKRQP